MDENDEITIIVTVKRKHLELLGKDISYTMLDLEQDRLLPHSPYTNDEAVALIEYYLQLQDGCYNERNQAGQSESPTPG